MKFTYLTAFVSALFLLGSIQAYYNITFVNTTVILYPNTSAHVIETFGLYVSNASTQQYVQNRDAVGVSLSDWQSIIYTTKLTEHIVSPAHSTYGFAFLPGPLVMQFNGGQALLTLSYYINNVTSIRNTAPRRFEYTFNDSVFNFESTANGQALPYDTRLNIILPSGAKTLAVYPLPDSPPPTYINNYSNFTSFSWFSGEPLAGFALSFTMTQSLQQEVLSYFSKLYGSYKVALYLIAVVVIVFLIVYVYLRSGREAEGKK